MFPKCEAVGTKAQSDDAKLVAMRGAANRGMPDRTNHNDSASASHASTAHLCGAHDAPASVGRARQLMVGVHASQVAMPHARRQAATRNYHMLS